ncbi:hypothetical protein D9757_014524 [Collybiopsis confluens]|uniref:Ubiquitin-like protease family profile domain-containing protein n=1 Tax=Collybiopsis confluens TaxID=2823264 RepID=A0A8H5D287_9AGAR|nr:hypothetical protein D9757_014524 [Collybiopsis confluens]
MSDKIFTRPPKPPDNEFMQRFIDGHRHRRKSSKKSGTGHVSATYHNTTLDHKQDLKHKVSSDIEQQPQKLSKSSLPKSKAVSDVKEQSRQVLKPNIPQQKSTSTVVERLQYLSRRNLPKPEVQSIRGAHISVQKSDDIQLPKFSKFLSPAKDSFETTKTTTPSHSINAYEDVKRPGPQNSNVIDNIGTSSPTEITTNAPPIASIEYSDKRLKSIIKLITDANIARLEPGQYLNDILIEYGLRLWHWQLEMTYPAKVDTIHIFNSFFYHQLRTFGPQESYNRVKTWTSNVDIFSKYFVIAPIHESFHWYLAVIHRPEFILPYHLESPTSPLLDRSEISPIQVELEPSGSNQQTIIYVLDSMGFQHPNIGTHLTNYLRCEANARKMCSNTLNPIVPKQSNAKDCGVYVLHFAERFVEYICTYSNPLEYNEKHWDITRLMNYRSSMKDILLNNIELLKDA